MKRILFIICISFFYLSVSTALAANKVVVVPLGDLDSNAAAGSGGQLQYNDNGETAGAEIYYDKDNKVLMAPSDRDVLTVRPGFSIKAEQDRAAISIVPRGSNFEEYVSFYFSYYLGGHEFMSLSRDGLDLKNTNININTLDLNGYAKLKPYSSAPVSCATSMRGTIVMNDDYDLCVCRPASLGSAYKLVRDPNLNCW